jgi:hypothetical protein
MKSDKDRKKINLVENNLISLKSKNVLMMNKAPSNPRVPDPYIIVCIMSIWCGGSLEIISLFASRAISRSKASYCGVSFSMYWYNTV